MTSRCWTVPDTNFWTKTAYTIPDTPHADMKPGQANVPMVPINKLNPRSFITNIKAGAKLAAGKPASVRGIAFGGDTGVKRWTFRPMAAKRWQAAHLGKDEGKYSFRQWQTQFTPEKGDYHADGPLHESTAMKCSRLSPTGIRRASCAT